MKNDQKLGQNLIKNSSNKLHKIGRNWMKNVWKNHRKLVKILLINWLSKNTNWNSAKTESKKLVELVKEKTGLKSSKKRNWPKIYAKLDQNSIYIDWKLDQNLNKLDDNWIKIDRKWNNFKRFQTISKISKKPINNQPKCDQKSSQNQLANSKKIDQKLDVDRQIWFHFQSTSINNKKIRPNWPKTMPKFDRNWMMITKFGFTCHQRQLPTRKSVQIDRKLCQKLTKIGCSITQTNPNRFLKNISI